ncbi:MAG: hypothetical protein ABSF22_06370 [Bryobacteraceae bacterium]
MHWNDNGHQHQKSEEKAEEPILAPETRHPPIYVSHVIFSFGRPAASSALPRLIMHRTLDLFGGHGRSGQEAQQASDPNIIAPARLLLGVNVVRLFSKFSVICTSWGTSDSMQSVALLVSADA